MSSTFIITLDTHAPVITWGAIDGADAGETLIVNYAIDEPAITSAELLLPGGATLPLAVTADTLSADLPGDVRQGIAVVSATVEDELGNTAVRTHDFVLGGVIQPIPISQMGVPRGAIEPRLIRDHSRAGTSSHDQIRVHVSAPSRVRARSRYSGPTHRVVRLRDRAVTRSGGQSAARMTSRSAAAVHTREDSILRREGPDHQAELLFLDIL